MFFNDLTIYFKRVIFKTVSCSSLATLVGNDLLTGKFQILTTFNMRFSTFQISLQRYYLNSIVYTHSMNSIFPF